MPFAQLRDLCKIREHLTQEAAVKACRISQSFHASQKKFFYNTKSSQMEGEVLELS